MHSRHHLPARNIYTLNLKYKKRAKQINQYISRHEINLRAPESRAGKN